MVKYWLIRLLFQVWLHVTYKSGGCRDSDSWNVIVLKAGITQLAWLSIFVGNWRIGFKNWLVLDAHLLSLIFVTVAWSTRGFVFWQALFLTWRLIVEVTEKLMNLFIVFLRVKVCHCFDKLLVARLSYLEILTKILLFLTVVKLFLWINMRIVFLAYLRWHALAKLLTISLIRLCLHYDVR
jgi:hypothetical protein